MNSRLLIRAGVILALCCAAAVMAAVMRPTKQIAVFGEQKLGAIIPEQFGDWRVDTSVVPVMPDPGLAKTLSRIYSDVLARTYVNSRGERMMLSLAYGSRQDDTMRVHQPEGCYAGQGFAVRRVGRAEIVTPTGKTGVVRLDTVQGLRREPVTYWSVIGGQHALGQWEGKLAQLGFGLRGYIPDGLLVRVSSISGDSAAAFELQAQFMRQLLGALPTQVAAGLTGV